MPTVQPGADRAEVAAVLGASSETFRAPELPGPQKLYVLDMFPYPSGDGLHVGHPEGYTATDIVCRFARMRGYDVLHPMGFDAFGLPAEEHAIKTNTPPRVQTERNIETFRRQLKMLGFSYDWERELATTDVDYFRWTQWIFLVLFDTWFDPEQQQGTTDRRIADSTRDRRGRGRRRVRRFQDEHRLAYQCDALVNWCPALGTVLANEEVIDGKSERGGTSGAADSPAAMDAADYRLRRSTGEWPGPARLVGEHQDAAAELDRTQHRRGSRFLHRPEPTSYASWKRRRQQSGWPRDPATMCCASTRRGRIRCSAPPTW